MFSWVQKYKINCFSSIFKETKFRVLQVLMRSGFAYVCSRDEKMAIIGLQSWWLLSNRTPIVCFSLIRLQSITISYNGILHHLTIFLISQINVFSNNAHTALMYCTWQMTPIQLIGLVLSCDVFMRRASRWRCRAPAPRVGAQPQAR